MRVSNWKGLVLILFFALCSGCASITGTTIQSVSVQTLGKDGKEASGCNCELSNKRGKWYVVSPGSVTISRSNDDLMVICTKDGLEPGRASVVSWTKGSMFGNIIFGGVVGAVIDHSDGSAYEYPTFFQVKMGGTITIDEEVAKQMQQTAPQNFANTNPSEPRENTTAAAATAADTITAPSVSPADPPK